MLNLGFITDVISLVFIVAGALQVFFASVGINRFPSTLARIHAVTKPQTVGLIMVIVGVIFRLIGDEHFDVGQRGDVGMLFLLVLFALMTNPVTAQRLGRISRREGLYGEKRTSRSTNTRATFTSSCRPPGAQLLHRLIHRATPIPRGLKHGALALVGGTTVDDFVDDAQLLHAPQPLRDRLQLLHQVAQVIRD